MGYVGKLTLADSDKGPHIVVPVFVVPSAAPCPRLPRSPLPCHPWQLRCSGAVNINKSSSAPHINSHSSSTWSCSQKYNWIFQVCGHCDNAISKCSHFKSYWTIHLTLHVGTVLCIYSKYLTWQVQILSRKPWDHQKNFAWSGMTFRRMFLNHSHNWDNKLDCSM